MLLRPDTYIGSTQSETKLMWVYDEATEKMIERQVKVIPGLHKIFDEVTIVGESLWMICLDWVEFEHEYYVPLVLCYFDASLAQSTCIRNFRINVSSP